MSGRFLNLEFNKAFKACDLLSQEQSRRVTHLFYTFLRKLAFSPCSFSGLFKGDSRVWVLSLVPFPSEFCPGTVARLRPCPQEPLPGCRTGARRGHACPGTAAAGAPETGAGTIKYAWALLQQTNLLNWKESGGEKWNLAVQLRSTIWWLLWDSSKGSYHCGHNLLDFKDPYEFWRHTK